MALVGMHHDHLPGAARHMLAAIAETLQAARGDADRVSVMAVRIIGMALEEGLDALEPRLCRGAPQPIAGRRAVGAAGSFKTSLPDRV